MEFASSLRGSATLLLGLDLSADAVSIRQTLLSCPILPTLLLKGALISNTPLESLSVERGGSQNEGAFAFI
jgi:hypothetical protein